MYNRITAARIQSERDGDEVQDSGDEACSGEVGEEGEGGEGEGGGRRVMCSKMEGRLILTLMVATMTRAAPTT